MTDKRSALENAAHGRTLNLSSPLCMQVLVDDYREAYWWLRDNTPEDARVMAWWDYGYQITGIGNRTTIADGNTWNHEHIATLGRVLSVRSIRKHSRITCSMLCHATSNCLQHALACNFIVCKLKLHTAYFAMQLQIVCNMFRLHAACFAMQLQTVCNMKLFAIYFGMQLQIACNMLCFDMQLALKQRL